MDDYKNSDNFQRTEGCKMISPHHFHPTTGVSPEDSIGWALRYQLWILVSDLASSRTAEVKARKASSLHRQVQTDYADCTDQKVKGSAVGPSRRPPQF